MARRFVDRAGSPRDLGAGPLLAVIRSALRHATDRLIPPAPGMVAAGGRQHPLAPAAIRVERSRSRGPGATAEQTAVTMWFGDGPALPGPLVASPAVRATMRVGAGMLGAAALAAASTLVARRSEERLAPTARAVTLPTPGPASRRVRPPAAGP